MAEPLNLFILAGEPSGDRIGADLVRRLRQRRELKLAGVGGSQLIAQGLQSLFPMAELSVMGWSDVLPRLPKLLWRVRQVAKAIMAGRPDIVVLIDSQVFCQLVARRVRRAGGSMPMVLYVAPSVWAWKPERAAALTPVFDAVLAVLPFEPAVMRRLGGPPTSYVGHPALDAIPMRQRQPDTGPVLLLPGSRGGQLKRHLPLMRHVAETVGRGGAVTGYAILTPEHLRDEIIRETDGWAVPVAIESGEPGRQRMFSTALAAVAITGTVTLELALAGVPMVSTYLGDKGQARRFRQYGVRFAALPNIVLETAVVPEILMEMPEPSRLADALAGLLGDEAELAAQNQGFERLRRLMEAGTAQDGREDPADRILALLV
jgi:lipid-A-disaccharide synthase